MPYKYTLTLTPQLMMPNVHWSGGGIKFRGRSAVVRAANQSIRERVATDPAGIQDSLRWMGKSWKNKVAAVKYQLDKQNIIVTFTTVRPLNDEQREEIREHVEEAGPDTWMEGDITLLDDDELDAVNAKLGENWCHCLRAPCTTV